MTSLSTSISRLAPARSRVRLAASVGAVAIALTACSGTPEAGPSGEAASWPNPCELLTAEQLTEIVGVTYEEGEYNAQLSSDTQSICQWSIADADAGFVQVLLYEGPDAFAMERDSANTYVGVTFELRVDGASGAYATYDGQLVGMQVGDYFVQIANTGKGSTDVTAESLAMAQAIASQLP